MKQELSEFEKKFLGEQLGKNYIKRSKMLVGAKWRIIAIEVTPAKDGKAPKTEIKIEQCDGVGCYGWTSLTGEQSRKLQDFLKENGSSPYLIITPTQNLEDGKYSLDIIFEKGV